MEPRIQYAKTSDGVSIAYWTLGKGQPFIICYSPGVSHIKLEWDFPEARWAYTKLAERRTVVRLDFRNHGLSTRDVEDVSPEAHLRDLEAVLDRLAASRCALHAGTLATKTIIRYAANHPEQISHITLYRPTVASGSRHDRTAGLNRILAQLIDVNWDLYCDVRAVATSVMRLVSKGEQPLGQIATR